MTSSTLLKRKQVDDVLGGADAWKNVDQTQGLFVKLTVFCGNCVALCDQCGNRTAYFMQVQIRSADEPMSTFYKCTKCGHRWNEI